MKSFSSKFAEDQLKKFGWKEGDGLGRNNQGKSVPIKVSLKFNNSGVGFNLSEQFTNNWWENLFDSTSKGLEDAEKRIGKEEKPRSVMNRKEYFYSRFQQESVLVGGQEVKNEPISDKQIKEKKEKQKKQKNQLKNVTDEDLYKLCEGRTAHKGARHGIKMSAKLARIEEQERLLAEKMLDTLNSENKKRKELDSDQVIQDVIEKTQNKKKKHKTLNDNK